MDKRSNEINECMKVCHLLKNGIKDGLSHLNNNDLIISSLAHKCLVLDIFSFMDELEVLKKVVYLEKGNFGSINHFLLTTNSARKFLNKNRDGLKNLRNTMYAHNYRDAKNDYKFLNPITQSIESLGKAPVLKIEIEVLARVCLLIISKLTKYFSFNDLLAFSELQKSVFRINEASDLIDKERLKHKIDLVGYFERDMYQIEDFLKSNPDNFEILAKKMRVKLKLD